MDALRERFDVDTRRSALYQDLKAGIAPAGIEYYLPLFFPPGREGTDATATLFDYLPDSVLPVLADGTGAAAAAFWEQTRNRYEQRRHDVEHPVLPPDALYLSPDGMRERLNRGSRVEVCGPDHPHVADAAPLGDQPAPALPVASRDHQRAGESLRDFIASYPGRVLVAADSPGRREALLEVLQAASLQPATVAGFPAFLAGDARFALAVAPLEDGFALDQPQLVVLTERQLFPERATQPRRARRAGREPEAIIRDLGELTEGAPIVHEDHGVGRYRGLLTMDIGGMPGEFLDIEYAKGDRLYVPVSQLHLVSRYSGASPETAPLHSLGGEQWTRAKRKAQEKVRDVAAELLEIQARRHARAGLALTHDLHGGRANRFGAGLPRREPRDAADILLRLAAGHDLVMLEFFETDEAGHARDHGAALDALSRLDAVLRIVVEALGPRDALVVASDHGNLEDLSTRNHTLARVPVLGFGRAADALGAVSDLTGIAPLLTALVRAG